MALIGNSIKISFTFKTDEGVLIDPISPVVTIYELANVVLETIPLIESHHIGTGLYELIYKIPDGKSSIVLEVTGSVDGIDRTQRIVIDRTWTSK